MIDCGSRERNPMIRIAFRTGELTGQQVSDGVLPHPAPMYQLFATIYEPNKSRLQASNATSCIIVILARTQRNGLRHNLRHQHKNFIGIGVVSDDHPESG